MVKNINKIKFCEIVSNLTKISGFLIRILQRSRLHQPEAASLPESFKD